MKKILIVLSLLILTGCFKGKDPVKDFPKVKEFVPEYDFKPQKIPKPPEYYYLDPKAFYFNGATNNIIKDNSEFSILVSMDGNLVKKDKESETGVIWDLQIVNKIDSVQLNQVNMNTWKLDGNTDDFEFEDDEPKHITIQLKAKTEGPLSDEVKKRLKFYDLTRQVNVSIVP